ncbi:hypothetical protein TNCV_2993561 [Trichonephila clavipes]|nr:hypothetical protein TNCV_2993561 [Trichonephila clavipes]
MPRTRNEEGPMCIKSVFADFYVGVKGVHQTILGGSHPSLLTTGPPPQPSYHHHASREDLWFDGYLEYPHAAKVVNGDKHSCLVWESNPRPLNKN